MSIPKKKGLTRNKTGDVLNDNIHRLQDINSYREHQFAVLTCTKHRYVYLIKYDP